MQEEIDHVVMRRGYIYKIVCKITGENYIGSTFKTLATRLAGHERSDNKCSSKQIIQRGNYKIKLLLECVVANKSELCKVEQKYIATEKCINKIAAHKEIDKSKFGKKYNCRGKIIIFTENYVEQKKNEKSQKANVKCACPCGGKYTLTNKSHHQKTSKHQLWLAASSEQPPGQVAEL